MKLQEATKRETLHILVGAAALAGAENIVYLLLGKWSLPVGLGSLFGAAVAVLNFFLLALTVQKAAASGEEKQAKLQMQLSYSLRMLLMLGVLVLGFVLPVFDGVATALPLLFPRLTIFFMQVTGLYKPEKADEGGKQDP